MLIFTVKNPNVRRPWRKGYRKGSFRQLLADKLSDSLRTDSFALTVGPCGTLQGRQTEQKFEEL